MRRVILLACIATSWLAAGEAAAQRASEPRRDDPARKAILDGMRRKGDDPSRVFEVKTLRVQGQWAWLVASTVSRDGRNRGETETALLRNENGAWKVVDQPCGEEDCDARKEIARIRKAWPAAPASLFARGGR